MPKLETNVNNKQMYQKKVYTTAYYSVWVRDYRSHTEVCGTKTYFVKTDGGQMWKRHVNQRKIDQSEAKQSVFIIPRWDLEEQRQVDNKEINENQNELVRSQLKPPGRILNEIQPESATRVDSNNKAASIIIDHAPTNCKNLRYSVLFWKTPF